MNLIQVADWILSNRSGKAFTQYSLEDIIRELMECSKYSSGLTITENGQLVGVVTTRLDHEKKLCYVYNVLGNAGALKVMFQYFITNYPDYKLYGMRHGKEKQFSRPALIENKL